MSQDVRARTADELNTPRDARSTPTVLRCGDRPGDLRVKVERRSRGRLEQASLRVRAFMSRVKPR